MIFSFLIASVSAAPTNTTGIGQSPSPTSSPIINRCGVDGVVPHSYVVTLKPPPANSNGRRLDTQDKLSYLQGWVHQYDPEDTSNDTTRRKLETNSNSTHILHLFTSPPPTTHIATRHLMPAKLSCQVSETMRFS